MISVYVETLNVKETGRSRATQRPQSCVQPEGLETVPLGPNPMTDLVPLFNSTRERRLAVVHNVLPWPIDLRALEDGRFNRTRYHGETFDTGNCLFASRNLWYQPPRPVELLLRCVVAYLVPQLTIEGT